MDGNVGQKYDGKEEGVRCERVVGRGNCVRGHVVAGLWSRMVRSMWDREGERCSLRRRSNVVGG